MLLPCFLIPAYFCEFNSYHFSPRRYRVQRPKDLVPSLLVLLAILQKLHLSTRARVFGWLPLGAFEPYFLGPGAQCQPVFTIKTLEKR